MRLSANNQSLLAPPWKLLTLGSLCTFSVYAPVYAANSKAIQTSKLTIPLSTSSSSLIHLPAQQYNLTLTGQPQCLTPNVSKDTLTPDQCLSGQGEQSNAASIAGALSNIGINPWVLLGGAGAGIAAAAAGGGGGGGGSGSGSSTPNTENSTDSGSINIGAPSGALPTQAAYYNTNEYRERNDLDAIKAKEAYANIARLNGANGARQGGQGITIAVLDTGIDKDHNDLKINIQPDCLDSTSCNEHFASYDAGSHGSHVAGIAAASKNGSGIHGVAYNATILPGCANLGSAGCSYGYVSDAELMLWAASHGATVTNMSYGYGAGNKTTGMWTLTALDVTGGVTNYNDSRLKDYLFDSYSTNSGSDYQKAQQALQQGLVTVLAAGNIQYWFTDNIPKASQPSVMAMAPFIYQDTPLANDLDHQWIAVVNTDNNGNLSPASHACGDAAEFCLAAPGTNIYSSIPSNNHGYSSGTSMAAPQVAGAFALVSGAFPTMTLPGDHQQSVYCDSDNGSYNSEQCHSKAVVNRLFVTATDIGEPGIDPIYGRGLLNLDSATRLIGEAQLQSPSGAIYNLSGSTLNTSTASGQVIARQLSSINFIAVDSYDKAGFLFSGEALLGEFDDSTHQIDTLRYLNRSMYSDTLATTTLSPGLQLQYTPVSHQDELVSGQYQLTHSLDNQSELMIGYGLDITQDFIPGQSDALDQASIITSHAFASPFSHFNDNAHSLGFQQQLDHGFTLNANIQQGYVTDEFNSQQDNLQTSSLTLAMSGSLVKDLKGSLVFGSMNEEESVLGSYGAGVWSTTNGSQSMMAGINLNYSLTPGVDALFSYYRVSTEAEQQGTAFEYSDTIQSDSFSMGLLASNTTRRWSYGFFVTQPLRINNGSTSLELPTGYNGNQLAYDSMDIDLTPDGRHMEYELAVGWESETLPLTSKVNLIRIEDYGNIAGNNDTLMLLSLGLKF